MESSAARIQGARIDTGCTVGMQSRFCLLLVSVKLIEPLLIGISCHSYRSSAHISYFSQRHRPVGTKWEVEMENEKMKNGEMRK